MGDNVEEEGRPAKVSAKVSETLESGWRRLRFVLHQAGSIICDVITRVS